MASSVGLLQQILCSVIFGSLVISATVYTDNCTTETCDLPDCYCRYKDIPGDLKRKDTPQMVLFTYTGPINKKVRQAIMDIFPDNLKNPNLCPIGITMFIISQGSDNCGTYRMYYRGHEVALAGRNRTGWKSINWEQQVGDQLFSLSEAVNIGQIDITGMRAQKLKPGGDEQFKMIQNIGLLYDSSILTNPTVKLDEDHPYYWPFTLDIPIKDTDLTCHNQDCPTDPYEGIWEIPVSTLISTRAGKPHPCTYLDDCLNDLKSGNDVNNLLKKHFLLSYNGNRAPFQVNLQARTLETKIAVEGLKEFIKYLLQKTDVWVVTNQEALRWVQQPVPLSNIAESGVWDCPERGDYVKCMLEGERNSTITRTTFRDIMNVDVIWIWQTIILVVLYFALYRYDKYQANSKRK